MAAFGLLFFCRRPTTMTRVRSWSSGERSGNTRTEESKLVSTIPRAAAMVMTQTTMMKPHSLAQAHSATPSSTTQFEIGNAQSQTDLAHPPTSVNNDHRFTPPSSHSPSDTQKSASAAEYQEWPFKVS
ncbi:hypothetical protein DL98DRAFT_220639 [Cadophora sp. DSE1049]|nr:hypothetical protein DL98DRAFT_220639 [Cadophora sp. DSE1049]